MFLRTEEKKREDKRLKEIKESPAESPVTPITPIEPAQVAHLATESAADTQPELQTEEGRDEAADTSNNQPADDATGPSSEDYIPTEAEKDIPQQSIEV